ncbi:TonB family protein, partial [Pseudomonas otitidis]
PRVEQRKQEQAALARKRLEEQKRQEQIQRETQRREQQRLEAERTAAEQQRQLDLARQAEQQRQAAERARQAAAEAAANSRQYLPIAKEAPDYPQRALDKGIQGDCTVEYRVNPQGRVENPQVVGDCHPLFIRPSLAAAQTFRYQPRLENGQPVAVPGVRNTFHYRIER